jgi:hypothetical protein
MTIEQIVEQQNKLMATINYEENLDCRNDKELIKECWHEWHTLEKIRKILLNSSVDN